MMQGIGWRDTATQLADPRNLAELRQRTLVHLAAAALLFGWLAAVRAFHTYRVDYLAVTAVLVVGPLSALQLRRRNLLAACYLLILSCIAATALETWLFPGGMGRHYYPVVVVASGLVVSHSGLFAVAAVAALINVAVSRWQGIGLWDVERVVNPTVFIFLTAAAAYLGSRQLQVALGWTETSYKRALEMLTELRERRAALARTAKALEEAYRRIERMNYALIDARAAAEDARRLKAEFAANISHELRTPLSLIIGFSETMANAPETYGDFPWPPSLRADVEQIYRASCHLSSLVDDILDLSALEVRRLGLTVEEVSVYDVLNEAVSIVAELFRAKGLYLQVEVEPGLPHVHIDRTRIRQVLLNLLNNASRFTSKGGVTVRARCAGREVEIAVADTGIGIAPQDVSKVFEEFRQVDGSTRREHGGTGLGVPLSKRLVELHGGRMWLESTPGKGTTFYFTLPLSQVQGLPADSPAGSGVRGAPESFRRTVLCAEPDPWLMRMLRRQIDRYELIVAERPEEVHDLVQRHQPVALMVNSPEGDPVAGLEAWAEAVPLGLPVIGYVLKGALGEARRLGAEGYLVKPIARSELLNAVEEVAPEGRDVLVVDDDPEFVELVCRYLQTHGDEWRPRKAYDGEEALERMRQRPPDLVLLDLSMPRMDGIEVLSAMRSEPRLARVPAIVISAREYPEGDVRQGGRLLVLRRGEELLAADTVNCLRAILDALPRPDPVRPGPAPGLPAAPTGSQVS